MAAEYGWKTDYILNMPYHRFSKLSNALTERKRKENDRELVRTLSQTHELREAILVSSMGEYEPVSFKKYLRNRNLDDLLARNFKISESEKEKAVNKAHDNVVDAVQMFSKGGE